MKIKFLGTAAYEGIPSLFCQCETCRKSLLAGGRNLRSRSQAIINDDLLIDFPPDTVVHFHRFKLDWNKIRNCLITHSHCDHLYVDDILIIRNDYCHVNNYKINYFSGDATCNLILDRVNKTPEKFNDLSVNRVESGKIYKIDNYEVIPLTANHDEDATPYIYVIKENGKSILYSNDTGYYSEEVWAQLKEFGPFDLISLDCTGSTDSGWVDGHMCIETNLKVIERMLREKIIHKDTIKAINHFSHNGKATYDELVEATKDLDIIVSYDGLEIEV